MSTSPEGGFCHVVIYFWGHFLKFSLSISAHTNTHTQTLQTNANRQNPFCHLVRADTQNFNLWRHYIKCATFTITCLVYCGADGFCLQKNTWHFQLMCFKSTYFWDCRSARALLAPAAPALHSNAWWVHCWRSLGLVSIYNNSWWVAVGIHLPVS